MSLTCCSANSHTAPTLAGTAPTEDGVAEQGWSISEVRRCVHLAGGAPLPDAYDGDKPHDTWGAADLQRPAFSERRPTGLYRCGCGHVYDGNAQCYGTSECGDVQPFYEDELEADEEGFEELSAPGVVPPGFRYSTSHGKAIPDDMHSSSHSAEKDYIDENGNEIDAQTEAGDEQPPRSAKRTHEVLCPNTPPASPKRARTTDPGNTSVFIPETPPREEREARFAELEKQVKALQQRVEVLEASEALQKTINSSLTDCIQQMRERLQQQA